MSRFRVGLPILGWHPLPFVLALPFPPRSSARSQRAFQRSDINSVKAHHALIPKAHARPHVADLRGLHVPLPPTSAQSVGVPTMWQVPSPRQEKVSGVPTRLYHRHREGNHGNGRSGTHNYQHRCWVTMCDAAHNVTQSSHSNRLSALLASDFGFGRLKGYRPVQARPGKREPPSQLLPVNSHLVKAGCRRSRGEDGGRHSGYQAAA